MPGEGTRLFRASIQLHDPGQQVSSVVLPFLLKHGGYLIQYHQRAAYACHHGHEQSLYCSEGTHRLDIRFQRTEGFQGQGYGR